MVTGLDSVDALEGKTLGVVVRDEPSGPEAFGNGLEPALEDAGHELAETVLSRRC